jgi:hypothetical protein
MQVFHCAGDSGGDLKSCFISPVYIIH